MLDLESVKSNSDLLAIVGRDTQLKKAANTGGGEWAGACPFPGCACKKDGFRVQVNHKGQGPRWYCRGCGEGRWHSVIDYIARRDSLDPKNHNDLQEICSRSLGGAVIPTTTEHKAAPENPPYSPPSVDWQAAAWQAARECESLLWQPEGLRALEYLRGRGLQDATIKHFRLGYNPEGRKINGEYWLDRGVTIPGYVGEAIWYLKVRRSKKDQTPNRPAKYYCMTGSRPAAIFNADALRGSDLALFCEGEFDTMICWQEVREIPAATMGAATNPLDLATWGARLLPVKLILSAYDADKAGQKGAAMLAEMGGNRVKLALLPDGQWKDITDFYLAGGDLAKWIYGYIDFYTDTNPPRLEDYDLTGVLASCENCHTHKR